MFYYHFGDTIGEPSSLTYRCLYSRLCSCLSVQWLPSSINELRYLLAGHRIVVVVGRSKVGPSYHSMDMIGYISRIHDRIETSSDEWIDVTDHPKASSLVVHL